MLIKHHWGALSPLLDLTTGVFPVTKVDLEKDVMPSDYVPISEKDKEIMEFCKSAYSPSTGELGLINADGSPKNHENALLGLAIIGRRLEEEKVTAMMGEITRCLQN